MALGANKHRIKECKKVIFLIILFFKNKLIIDWSKNDKEKKAHRFAMCKYKK